MKVSIKLWGLLALLASLYSFAENTAPNILFIIADDLGYGDVGVFYQDSRNFAVNRDLPAFDTPSLDTLASEGLRFTRHYSASPVCAPARASLLTGRHQGHATVRDNQFDAALEDTETLASVLKSAGYATAAIGKWGLGGPENEAFPGHPMDRGFDYFFGIMAHRDAHSHYFTEFNVPLHDARTAVTAGYENCYSTDLFTARAKQWITDQHTAMPDQPFMLYLAYTAPHARLQVPTQAYPVGGMQWIGTPGQMISTASGTHDSWIHPDYIHATWDDDADAGTAEVAWPDYAKRHATMVRRLDSALNDLQQFLDDLDLRDNTLIIFTSDNGPHNESGYHGTYTQDPRFFRSFGPLDGTKRDLWEGGLRVPTFVSWPAGIETPSVSTRPSQFHDWLPTFADLAGVEVPAKSDGVSLLPEITGLGHQADGIQYSEYTPSSGRENTESYGEFDPSHRGATRGHMQSLYVDGLKGVRYNVNGVNDHFRVYETDADPQEIINLFGQPTSPENQEFVDATLRLRRPHASLSRAYDDVEVPATDEPFVAATVQVFPGSYGWVPRLSSVAARTVVSAIPGVEALQPDESAALLFEGTLTVPETGAYTFYLRTDLGAIVRLHDMLLIDADKGYVSGSDVDSGTVHLEAGQHPIRIYSHHQGNAPFLELEWAGPEFPRQSIPGWAFTDQSLNSAPEVEIHSPDAGLRLAPDLGLKIEGEVTDDGVPEGSELEIAWTVMQMPEGGTAVLDPQDQINTSVSFDVPGFYQLQCSVSDGILTRTKMVDVLYDWDDAVSSQQLSFSYPFESNLEDVAGLNHGVGVGDYGFEAGAKNTAIYFSDANAYVDSSQTVEVIAGSSWTVGGWFRLESLSPVNGMILQQLDGTGTGRSWLYVIEDGGKMRLASYLGGNATLGGEVMLNQWHHGAVVISGGTLILYLDGVEVARSTRTLEGNTGKFRIGNFKTASEDRQWIGGLDDVRGYARALTDAELRLFTVDFENQAPEIQLQFPEEAVGYQPFLLSAVATDDSSLESALSYAWSALPSDPISFTQTDQSEVEVALAGAGTIRFQVVVGDGFAKSFKQADLLVISPSDAWRKLYFGGSDNVGDGANTADPNDNGLPNLLERAFGRHPIQPAEALSPKFKLLEDADTKNVGMRFHRLSGGRWVNAYEYQFQDLIYRVYGGTNLLDSAVWSLLPLIEVSAVPTGEMPDSEVVDVRTDQSLSEGEQFFMRLEVLEANVSIDD